ncbi:cell division inhibitor SulA [Cellvibrio sp. pealriver]|uniref:cell division inhibitor SulA n=1 Tax=Cellvibrio sp. pealriver TaxID=1622269 RepID=UPI00066FEF75|nr:SulA-like leucine-rich domain-containing protein [Cellvibrio sp. pealriver]
MTNIAHAIAAPASATPQANSQQQQPASGVTELVLASDSPEQLALLLPMIAFLGNACKDRWITWVAPHNISRDLLESYGVNTRYIRVIHCQDPQTLLWITWEALSAGNSHTVISSPGKLSDKELAQLEVAATKGNCRGLLLRVR